MWATPAPSRPGLVFPVGAHGAEAAQPSPCASSPSVSHPLAALSPLRDSVISPSPPRGPPETGSPSGGQATPSSHPAFLEKLLRKHCLGMTSPPPPTTRDAITLRGRDGRSGSVHAVRGRRARRARDWDWCSRAESTFPPESPDPQIPQTGPATLLPLRAPRRPGEHGSLRSPARTEGAGHPRPVGSSGRPAEHSASAAPRGAPRGQPPGPLLAFAATQLCGAGPVAQLPRGCRAAG